MALIAAQLCAGSESLLALRIRVMTTRRGLPGCRSYEDLLSAAPSDISQADKVAKKQAREEGAQQLEQARQKVHVSSMQHPCR